MALFNKESDKEIKEERKAWIKRKKAFWHKQYQKKQYGYDLDNPKMNKF